MTTGKATADLFTIPQVTQPQTDWFHWDRRDKWTGFTGIEGIKTGFTGAEGMN